MSETRPQPARRRVWAPKTSYTKLGTGPTLVLPISEEKRRLHGEILTFAASGACQSLVSALDYTGEAVTLLDGEYLLSRPHDEIAFESEMDPPRGRGPRSTDLNLRAPRTSVLNHIRANSKYYRLGSLLADMPPKRPASVVADRYLTYERARRTLNTRKGGRDEPLESVFCVAGNDLYIRNEHLEAEAEFLLSWLSWVKRAQLVFLRATNWHLMRAPGSPKNCEQPKDWVPEALWYSARLPAIVPHLDLTHPDSFLNIARRPTYLESRRLPADISAGDENTVLAEIVAYASTVGTSHRGSGTAALCAATASARYLLEKRWDTGGNGDTDDTFVAGISALAGLPEGLSVSFIYRYFWKTAQDPQHNDSRRSRRDAVVLAERAKPSVIRNRTAHVVVAAPQTHGTCHGSTLTHLYSAGAALLSKWVAQRS